MFSRLDKGRRAATTHCPRVGYTPGGKPSATVHSRICGDMVRFLGPTAREQGFRETTCHRLSSGKKCDLSKTQDAKSVSSAPPLLTDTILPGVEDAGANSFLIPRVLVNLREFARIWPPRPGVYLAESSESEAVSFQGPFGRR